MWSTHNPFFALLREKQTPVTKNVKLHQRKMKGRKKIRIRKKVRETLGHHWVSGYGVLRYNAL
jgi:hypothetical protein